MKQLFSQVIAILSLIIFSTFLLKYPILYELALLVFLLGMFLFSMTIRKNRTLYILFFGISILNSIFLYVYSGFTGEEVLLSGILSLIGFFFEFGKSEVVKIPVKERNRLMQKWGMQKIQPISVDDEIESEAALKDELRVAKKLRQLDKLEKSAKEFEKEIKLQKNITKKSSKKKKN